MYKSVGHSNIACRCVVCGTVTCGFRYFGRIPDSQASVESRAYKIVRRLVEIGTIEPKFQLNFKNSRYVDSREHLEVFRGLRNLEFCNSVLKFSKKSQKVKILRS